MKDFQGLIVVGGPTASGKTMMAANLAEALGTEVVSFDARQVYKELNIAVARPAIEELKGIPHHFIATESIFKSLSAKDYAQKARKIIEKILTEKRVVILVGGSGFYLDALLFPLDDIPEPSEEARKKARNLPLLELQKILKDKDPIYFDRVDIRNPVRLQRAVEVILTTGRTFSEFLNRGKEATSIFPWILVQPVISSEKHKQYIRNRTDGMLQRGLLNECQELFEYRQMQPLKSVGYKEIFAWMEKRISLAKAVELINSHTWQYARRQKTWFNNKYESIKVDPSNWREILQNISNSKLP